MIWARTLSRLYENNDIRKFKFVTPAEVWSIMARCWEVEPTSERIVEDILKFPMVLDRIIEAEGCVVFDLFLRTGRRGQEWERKDGKGECENKPRSSQRKDTIKARPVHVDCIEAFESLTIIQLDLVEEILDQEEILIEEEILNLEGEGEIEIDVEDEVLQQLMFDLNDILDEV